MSSKKFIEITADLLWSGNNGNCGKGSVHRVLCTNERGVLIMGLSREVLLYEDEFLFCEGPVKSVVLEKPQKIFEKNQPESNNSIKFVSSLKQLNMSKKETTVQALTKTEMAVVLSIVANPKKGKAVKQDNKALIKVPADLAVVDKDLPGIDAAKVCRKLHRAGLITYTWLEDKSREVAITAEGFEALQIPVKVKGLQIPVKPKAEKKAKTAKAKPEAEQEDETEEEENEMPEGFKMSANPVAKVFNVTFPDGEKYRLKVKTAQEFKDVKSNTYEEWETLRDMGELTLVD